jgi:hypothetical protein
MLSTVEYRYLFLPILAFLKKNGTVIERSLGAKANLSYDSDNKARSHYEC